MASKNRDSLTFTVTRREPELVRPSEPSPREYKRLSDIDDQESFRFQMPIIQFFPCTSSLPWRDPVQAIREGLAKALVYYYPFAGRLREFPGRKLVVDCTGEGVMFIEADADVTLEQFGHPLQPLFPCFKELLFDVPSSAGILDCPLLLIQQPEIEIERGSKTIVKMERRVRPPQKNGRNKDKDDDLLLFRELHRRTKDRPVSLLQPVSDEFEPNGVTGNYPLYRIAPGKKSSGREFLAENDKNDYDWLKTPPATPLFPSLEMETNAEEYVVQREIPIMQPFSRFAGQSMSNDATVGRSKHPIIKPNAPLHPPRIEKKNNISTAFILNQKIAHEMGKLRIANATTTSKLAKQLKPPSSIAASAVVSSNSLPKSIGTMASSKTKPRSRGVSPMTRSSMPTAPTNDMTDRAISIVRGRPMTTSINGSKLTTPPQGGSADSNPNLRRQSCSPRRTRSHQRAETISQGTEAGSSSDRGRGQSRMRSQVLGSRMVDRVMNARKAAN